MQQSLLEQRRTWQPGSMRPDNHTLLQAQCTQSARQSPRTCFLVSGKVATLMQAVMTTMDQP